MNAVPDPRHHPDHALTSPRHAGESRNPIDAGWLLAHYERIADAPDAVARLRRFVLDLAVQGKLVEQDPNDEPATELASQFSEDDKIEVDAAVSDKFPSGLPPGWTTAPLRALVRVLNGRAYKKRELLEEGTPVLRVGNLFTSKKWYYSDLELDDDKYCTQGDLIFAWSASFGPFIWYGPRAIFHYHIWKLPIRNEAHVDKHFLYQFLLQKTREIKNAGHGISMVHMTKHKMERLLVPLPPLAEQHRIVVKVDELMALCDRLEAARTRRAATRDRLATASLRRLTASDTDATAPHDHARFALDHLQAITTRPDQIKALRQTILDLAVRGKLVEQKSGDGAASDLMQSLDMFAIANKQNRRSRTRAVGDIAAEEKYFDIHPTWKWVRLYQIGTTHTGATPSSNNKDLFGNSIPFVKPADLNDNRINAGEKWLSEEGARHSRCIPENSVLMVCIGASLGKTNISDRKICFNQQINAITPYIEDMAPFLCAALKSSYFQRAAWNKAGMSTLPIISKGKWEVLPVPLPPRKEQHRIVAKVDQLMALCDQLEASLAKAETTRSRLLEASLREALQSPARDTETA